MLFAAASVPQLWIQKISNHGLFQATGTGASSRSVRRMAALVTSEKPPGRWWVTTRQDRGMDVLGGEDSNEYPIIAFGSTFLAVQNNGGTFWGPGIPKSLDDKLRGRQKELPKVNLLCLGSLNKELGDAYYVQFEDGTSQWSDQLDRYLQGFLKGSTKVTALAIAPGDSYYCRNDDGREIRCNLPKGLDDALTGRKNSLPRVKNVNLGPDGEWFVRFEDGSWSTSGYTNSCRDRIKEIKGNGGRIREILFGRDHTWMIRYDE